jgi:hypothetical protein
MFQPSLPLWLIQDFTFTIPQPIPAHAQGSILRSGGIHAANPSISVDREPKEQIILYHSPVLGLLIDLHQGAY